MKFGLFIKHGGISRENIVFTTYQTSLEEAKKHFINLKRLSKEKFDKLFVVMEVKDAL
tara:strand:+ start:797 stop:970 length:174 start_codon:yes stop_codon:yes gene_type:complete